MNYLNLRVILNGTEIYQLTRNKPVLIPVKEKTVQLVVTDGFHITKALELTYNRPAAYRLKVVCAIDDNLMYVGLLLTGIFAGVGVFSDIALMRILSFVPIFYFLFLYYIKRREFIQIKIS